MLEYEKKLFEAEHKYEIEKRRYNQLRKELSKILTVNKDIGCNVAALKKENVDLMQTMNSVLLEKLRF